jgi:hypothetical protein
MYSLTSLKLPSNSSYITNYLPLLL